MRELMVRTISGLGAMVAVLALGHTSWSQETCGEGCQTCFVNAEEDKQAICECQCKWLTPKEMSRKECLVEVCGSDTGGVGSRIGGGSVFAGIVYPTAAESIAAAHDFSLQHGLTDNVKIVMKDFHRITENSDSWLVHLIGTPVNLPECSEDSCVVLAASLGCTAGTNQDSDPFKSGCQPGVGCYETPPSLWGAQGCPTTVGCCNSEFGCLRTGGADTEPGNGRYGTDSLGCVDP